MKRLVLGLSASALFAVPALAQFPYTLDFHFQPPSYSGCAEPTVGDALLECDTFDTNYNDFGDFTPNFAWAIVANVPARTGSTGGIGGIQFGIQYTAGTSLTWTLCTGGSQVPQSDALGTWPASGTGNAITWGGGCKEVTANEDGATIVGFFAINPRPVGVDGTIAFIEDPRTGRAEAADCFATTIRICRQSLGVGSTRRSGTGSGGVKQCGDPICPTPISETTWGSIKATYAN
jgi:hypothetical protein